MKKIWILIIIIALAGLGFWYFNKNKTEGLVSSKSNQQAVSEEKKDSGPKAGQKVPKEFKYDGSSDLSTELENINPEVSDSDFSKLKTLIEDL